MSVYFLCLVLFSIGLYCVLRRRNIIKIIIGISIMEYAVNLFFILIGYRWHGRAPLLSQNQEVLRMVDPIPQELILISIVIGLSVLALLVAIAIKIFDKYNTFDITKIRKLKG
ncbi:MAG: sodium:proton antiporter [Candidatus Omnitrophica bacterium]|nr:sodium:proton antiporter [Candidatus Omnitrophota bacterium]MDD5352502.1 sodium:proton antiporter [Candidatus Omnitrophota bacterium]MDD5550100.1 sodium:proton antiporter [Candidatus Omnitrophota bacterium]